MYIVLLKSEPILCDLLPIQFYYNTVAVDLLGYFTFLSRFITFNLLKEMCIIN